MEKIANLAQVYFLPVWKKLESQKQVRFRMSALAEMIKFLVALGRKLMKESIKPLLSWHYCVIRCKNCCMHCAKLGHCCGPYKALHFQLVELRHLHLTNTIELWSIDP